MQMQEGVACPWFVEDDYESFRTAVPDRHWHDTFGDWLKAAQQTKENIRASGKIPLEVEIRSAPFLAWCRETGRNVESRRVVEYATHLAIEKMQRSELH